MNAKKIILSAFYDLLQRQSINTISVSRIIEAAEVSKPTFYRYFYNKFDLLNQVFEDILAPMHEAGLRLTWREALCQTFVNVEANRAIFRNGFKAEEQFYLRNHTMQQIFEGAVKEMLCRKNVRIDDQAHFFSIRACVITHVAAMCGWALDNHRQQPEEIVDLLMGTLPNNIYPYFAE